jgi:hypothetical protein
MLYNLSRSSVRMSWSRDAIQRRSRPLVDPLETRELLALLGQQLFPSDNPWNQNISSAPVAPNSTSIINNIISQYGNGQFHPDFGEYTQSDNPLYGIPFNVVHGDSVPKVNVVIDGYPTESDIEPAPIPANAVIEGDNQNGPVTGLAKRGDSHLIVWDEDNNIAYEFYQASRPSENADGEWHAVQETFWNLNTDTFRTLGWTSADAAGLPILPGLVRPDEALPVSQGGQGVIDHAIRVTLQNDIILNQFIYPASHVANPGNTNASTQVPMGARLRLKANVNISQLSPESQVIARAMQQYGLIVADNGSNFFATGASYSVGASNNVTLTWKDNDIQDPVHGLKSLTYSDFEVVDLAPVVTGLSASSGPAGSTIGITGTNFSGAAGRLQVLFGSIPAAKVTVVDDSHLEAVVPPGAGTVDVTVQCGVTEPDPENINNPVFGYGNSTAVSTDRFTYGASTENQPPTVVEPASATSSPVTGTTVGLAALGAEVQREGTLTYTWQVVTAPTGASPIFSVNGTNAAKNTLVTFNRAGAYTFEVTIASSDGLTATSSVPVTVNQHTTRIVVLPWTASILVRGRQQFSAEALDQFAEAMAIQPSFTWLKRRGRGSINRTGLYKAPASGRGTTFIQASASEKSSEATIMIVQPVKGQIRRIKRPFGRKTVQ